LPLWKTEREVLGVSHGEVGAYLLGLWGLPAPIIEAIAFHHTPTRAVEKIFAPLTAVHIANVCDKDDGGKEEDDPSLQVDHEYLSSLNLGNRLSAWERICKESAEKGGWDES